MYGVGLTFTVRNRTIRSGAGQFGIGLFSGSVIVLLGLGIGMARALEKALCQINPLYPVTYWLESPL
jgi:hypothetical protein